MALVWNAEKNHWTQSIWVAEESSTQTHSRTDRTRISLAYESLRSQTYHDDEAEQNLEDFVLNKNMILITAFEN